MQRCGGDCGRRIGHGVGALGRRNSVTRHLARSRFRIARKRRGVTSYFRHRKSRKVEREATQFQTEMHPKTRKTSKPPRQTEQQMGEGGGEEAGKLHPPKPEKQSPFQRRPPPHSGHAFHCCRSALCRRAASGAHLASGREIVISTGQLGEQSSKMNRAQRNLAARR